MGGRHQVRPKKATSLMKNRPLRHAEDFEGENYARCKTLLGSGRFVLQMVDGTEVQGKIRGSMYRRVWINTGDLVLAVERNISSKTEAIKGKYDIVHKYTYEEEKSLVRYGEIPKLWALHIEGEEDENEAIVFEDEDIDFDAL